MTSPLGLVARVGARSVVLPASDVLKVLALPALCRLPRVTPMVRGIAQHRGRVITVFDAHWIVFGEPAPREPIAEARVVVLDRSMRNLALLVDGVEQIAPLPAASDRLAEPASLWSPAWLQEAVVHLVDTDRLCSRLEQLALEPPAA